MIADRASGGPRPSDALNELNVHVGGRIRLRRLGLGLSLERCSEMLGISFQMLSLLERGEGRTNASRLYDLARIFDVSVDFFFEGLEGTINTAEAPAREPDLQLSKNAGASMSIMIRAFRRLGAAERRRVLAWVSELAQRPHAPYPPLSSDDDTGTPNGDASL